MKLTEWYPPRIKPIRIGVYITRDNGQIFFQYWSGNFWKTRCRTIEGAYGFKDHVSSHQNVEWKGMSK
jgi:hypothetical protein